MLSPLVRRAAALSLLLLVSTPAAAASAGHKADLRFGPLVGGQNLRLDLRTSIPAAPFALLLGTSGTPTVAGNLPALGVNLAAPHSVFILATNAAGRFAVSLPTAAGQFGPAGVGVALFFQAVVLDQDGLKIASNVEATEIEPLAPTAGYLVEDAASYLPAGFDMLGGNVVEVGDLDRDGFPDLVIGTDVAVHVWLNDGDGAFADATATSIVWTGEALGTLRLGDVDGDNDLDLVTGGGYDDFVSIDNRLWLNNGQAVFTEQAGFPAGAGLASQIELADVERDGDLDIFVANGAEGHLTVPGGLSELLINLGGGQFVSDPGFEGGAWNDPTTPTTAVRAGDIDSDGDLDILLCKADTSGVDGLVGEPEVLLVNDGFGGFTDVSLTQIIPLRSDNTQDAVFADIDGDLDLDVLLANSVFSIPAADSNDVLINQGGAQGGVEGVFLDDPSSFLEPNSFGDGIRLSVHAEDADADGDADALVTIHDLFAGADQMLFLNQGGAQHGVEGVFVRQLWFDPPGSGTSGLGDFVCWGAAIFDADHDGDREILLCGNGVIGSDPLFAFTTRYLINGKL